MSHRAGNVVLRPDEQQLSLGVFTLVLALSLWQVTGSLVLGAADGGSNPLRRLLIGMLLVVLTAVALWRRESVCACLRARPWLVLPLAVAYVGAAAFDGLLPSGPYLAVSATAIALAVFVAGPRLVWLTVVVLDLSYAAAILVEQSLRELVADGHLSGVLGGLLGFPFVALVGLGLVRLFARFSTAAKTTLQALRDGAPALTPALTLAIEHGPRALPQLPAPPPAAELTPTERRVVEGLAAGSTPKQLALTWGLSITTVRTHIRHAKRKTHARTLTELAGMSARADWPARSDHEG